LKQSKYSATFLDWQLEKLFDFFSLNHESTFYLTEGLMNSTPGTLYGMSNGKFVHDVG